MTSFEGQTGPDGMIHFPDGSVAVPQQMPAEAPEARSETVNLAQSMRPEELRTLGLRLKDAIEADQQSQDVFMSSVANILQVLGINAVNLAEGGLNKGQAGTRTDTICSSALFETLLDLTATVMSSILPGKSPVTCQILGEPTPDLEAAAYRKAAFFNAWLQVEDKGFEKELRRIVVWSILTGSVYCKVYVDSVLDRPTVRMIRPQDFIINRDLSSHLSAVRKTQVHRMTAKEMAVRKANGDFLDEVIRPDEGGDDDGPVTFALGAISGSTQAHNTTDDKDDRVYRLYECHVETVIPGDRKAGRKKIPSPYIVMLDADSGKVLRVERNWKEEDPNRARRECFVNFSFLPSLDGEGYGLIQTSGASAQVSTEILRELIRAGSYASMPGGFVTSVLNKGKTSVSPQPGEFVDLRTNVPLTQAVMALPFKEPSQALFELKNQIEDSIRRPSAIINHKVADMQGNAPMGSTLAILESLQKVPNFVLQGYHQSFFEVLNLLNECFFDWLSDDTPYPFKVPGQAAVMMRSDFTPHLQVLPACDPTLQSGAYRLMRAEMILANALKAPDLHNMLEVEKLFYKNLQIPEEQINQLLKPDPSTLPPPPPPPCVDPVTENSMLASHAPVKVYPAQDHDAHIVVHKALLSNPDIGQNPALASAIQAHVYEHIVASQAMTLQMRAGIQIPENPQDVPLEIQNQIAVQAAQVLQAEQQQQQAGPSPDMLNAQAAMTAAEAEQQMVQVKAQQAQLEAQLEAQIKEQQMALEHRKVDLEEMRLRQDQSWKEQKLSLDEAVAQGKDARDAAKTELDLRKGEVDLVTRSQNLALHQVKGEGA